MARKVGRPAKNKADIHLVIDPALLRTVRGIAKDEDRDTSSQIAAFIKEALAARLRVA